MQHNRLVCSLCSRQWPINADTFSEVLLIFNWCSKHHVRHHDGEKWISHAGLLIEVPSTSIEY